MVVWGSYLDDQIERLVDNPHIVNAKKGSKMTPICGINRGETCLGSNLAARLRCQSYGMTMSQLPLISTI